MYQELSNEKFSTEQEVNAFFDNIIKEKIKFLEFDYNQKCKHLNKGGQYGTWVEYMYHVIKRNVGVIEDFLPAYFPFLSAELYSEIYDFVSKMNEIILYEFQDLHILKNGKPYFENNKNILIINALPVVMDRIYDIERYLKEEK